MIREAFAVGDSVFHDADPRLKVLFAALYSMVVALSREFLPLAAALACSVLMVFLARLDGGEVFRRSLPVNGFVALLWLVVPLTFQGEVLARWGPLELSRAGVVLSAQITLKANGILLALAALASTSSVASLGHALDRLRVPPKIVHLLLLTYRYVFVMEQEYLRLATAMKVRCFRPSTNRHTYRSYAYLVGMLFVRAAARGDRVHQAMVCRGFDGKFHSLRDLAFSRRDRWTAVAMVALLAVLAGLEWHGRMAG